MIRPRRYHFPSLFVLLLAAAIVVSTAAFAWQRLAGPSDGVRLLPGAPVWRAEGVVVSPLAVNPGGMQAGDLVIAIEGRSLNDWAAGLFCVGSHCPGRPAWRSGQNLTYTVLRAGAPLEVPVKLRPAPLAEVLRTNWGVLLSILMFQVVAVFVFVNRPDLPAARTLLLIASSLAGASTWSFGLSPGDFVNRVGFWLYQAGSTVAYLLMWVSMLHFVLVFPKPLIWVRQRPWTVWLVYAVPFAAYLAGILAVLPISSTALDWIRRWDQVHTGVVVACLALAVAAAAWSYFGEKRDLISRLQMRWLIYTFTVIAVLMIALGMLPELILGRALIDWNLLALTGISVPLALAAAILRYRLFDIDLIIHRTLTYGVLSVVLALVYFGSVAALQSLVTTAVLAGRPPPAPLLSEPLGRSASAGSAAVTVASTLACAALFAPVRRRIQEFIDRRFYRRKYDTAQMLSQFAATARDETDLERLSGGLVAAVQETMQPTHVSIWLSAGEAGRR